MKLFASVYNDQSEIVAKVPIDLTRATNGEYNWFLTIDFGSGEKLMAQGFMLKAENLGK